MERAITGGMDKGFLAKIGSYVFNAAKTAMVDRTSKKIAEDRESNAPGHKGYYRSMFYTSPADFYNHKSGTFSRNRRAQIKLAGKRR